MISLDKCHQRAQEHDFHVDWLIQGYRLLIFSNSCIKKALTSKLTDVNHEPVNIKMKQPIWLVLTLTALCVLANPAYAQAKKSVAKEPNPSCFIAEFRHIGASVHDPLERERQAKNWLIQNVGACSIDKLKMINANRSSWLGTSDSSFFMTMLDSMIEYKSEGNPEMLAQIFNSAGKEGTASVQMTSVTQAPRAQAAYDAQMYQQQYQQYQQQPYAQNQQQPAYPQAAYPTTTQGGGR